MASLEPKVYLKIMVDIPKAKVNGIDNKHMILKILIAKFSIDAIIAISRVRTNLS